MDLLKQIALIAFAILEVIAIALGVVSYPKTKKLDLVSKKEYALQLLPEAIKAAEASKQGGALKKDFVLSSVLVATEQKYGRFNNQDKVNFIKYVNESLEATLETPQKKGVANESEKG